jgi:hypothetical protein
MQHIAKNQLDWRIMIWLLLLISIFGPWVFDSVYVPAENPCSIRLRENFCGKPVIGLWLIAIGLDFFFFFIQELVKGTAGSHNLAHNIVICFMSILLVLPILNTLLMTVFGSRRFMLVFHLVACSAAAVAGLIIGFSAHYNRFWLLWGVWLYVAALAGALILEVIVLVEKSRLSPLPISQEVI